MRAALAFESRGHALVVARRRLIHWVRGLYRRAFPPMGVLTCIITVSSTLAGPSLADAPEGHCYAMSRAGGCAEDAIAGVDGKLLPGEHVFFAEPTTRYAHGVLGDAVEWGQLVYVQVGSTGAHVQTARFVLPQDRVFEDLTPRLADVNGDGSYEIIVVESQARMGAQLSVYGLRGEELVKITSTPHIGTRNRWLAPLGVADLDGDGAIELAFIDRPHLAKTLRVWRYTGGDLIEVAAIRGLTNHKIGEAFISGGIRDCGDGPEIVTADASWRSIMGTRLVDGTLKSQPLGVFSGPASFAPILNCEK